MRLAGRSMTNENQRAIIEAGDEPLLVVAGPGAGKTYVLEQRVRRLLVAEPESHFRILAITFTNVAASNLKRRLNDLEYDHNDRLEIGTFHSFAARVLQQHGSHVGLSPDFSIISAIEDREAIAAEAFADMDLPSDVSTIIPLISRRYERGVYPDDVIDASGSEPYLDRCMQAYRNLSIARGQMDFPLLIYVVLELFTRYPALAKLLRKIYRYICVDEFQDTNRAQFQLIELLASGDPRGILFLADQDQVIYQWNGASPRRLREAQEFFNMKVLLLPTSFRCPPVVLKAANRLISHNAERFVSPDFRADEEREGDISIRSFESETAEADWIVSELAEETDRDDTVVLARNRSTLERILRAAEKAQVRASIPTTRYEFESAPLSMLHSMLRLANVSDNVKALDRLVASFFQMTGRVIDAEQIRSDASALERNPLSVFFSRLVPVAVTSEFKELAHAVDSDLVERRHFRAISALFFAWVERIASATDWARTAYLASYEEERAVWEEFEILHRGLASDKVTLGEFLRALDLASKEPVRYDVVRLLTVHAAKGLEFRRVYIVGATDGQFPAFQAVKLGDTSDAMEEERRSFFVAITRSRDRVIVSYSRHVRGYAARPSRFLAEMGIA
jgi:DNA helicase-2/ATP-dependent DNA helicase PcrA